MHTLAIKANTRCTRMKSSARQVLLTPLAEIKVHRDLGTILVGNYGNNYSTLLPRLHLLRNNVLMLAEDIALVLKMRTLASKSIQRLLQSNHNLHEVLPTNSSKRWRLALCVKKSDLGQYHSHGINLEHIPHPEIVEAPVGTKTILPSFANNLIISSFT